MWRWAKSPMQHGVRNWKKGKGTVDTNEIKDLEMIANVDEALQDCTTAQ